jgi:hypothetical protein
MSRSRGKRLCCIAARYIDYLPFLPSKSSRSSMSRPPIRILRTTACSMGLSCLSPAKTILPSSLDTYELSPNCYYYPPSTPSIHTKPAICIIVPRANAQLHLFQSFKRFSLGIAGPTISSLAVQKKTRTKPQTLTVSCASATVRYKTNALRNPQT